MPVLKIALTVFVRKISVVVKDIDNLVPNFPSLGDR